MKLIAADRIVNAEAVTRIFGDWPSFHDAEVIAMRLDRRGGGGKPQLEVDIHTWEVTPEVMPDGHRGWRKHTLVGLRFEAIDDLSLEDFNHQNVLFDVVLTDVSDRGGSLHWEVAFNSSFGLSASFLCGTITVVRAEPFDPEGSDPLGAGSSGVGG